MEGHTGRPSKAVIATKKKGMRGKRGRPAGDAAALEEFRARILTSPKSRKLFDKIMEAALDDSHDNQAAAWKILMDRALPVSLFEKGNGAQRPTVQVIFSGIGGPQAVEGQVIEGGHDSGS